VAVDQLDRGQGLENDVEQDQIDHPSVTSLNQGGGEGEGKQQIPIVEAGPSVVHEIRQDAGKAEIQGKLGDLTKRWVLRIKSCLEDLRIRWKFHLNLCSVTSVDVLVMSAKIATRVGLRIEVDIRGKILMIRRM
jgi:hypothetical protein